MAKDTARSPGPAGTAAAKPGAGRRHPGATRRHRARPAEPATARAAYFRARGPVLDEPAAALGAKRSGMVPRCAAAARAEGLGAVLLAHNPRRACLVGDGFVPPERGAMSGSHRREHITLDELTREMAGGSELDELTHELSRTPAASDPAAAADPETTA